MGIRSVSSVSFNDFFLPYAPIKPVSVAFVLANTRENAYLITSHSNNLKNQIDTPNSCCTIGN